VSAQQDVIRQTLTIAGESRRLELVQQTEAISRKIAEAQALTRQEALELERQERDKEHKNSMARIESEVQAHHRQLEAQQQEQEKLGAIMEAKLLRKKAADEADVLLEQQRQALELQMLEAEVAAVVSKAQAVSPELNAA
jgi:major vault protein